MTTTDAVSSGIAGPRRRRVQQRNRLLTTRYYYWTELCRRREDDVRKILCDREFFVEERTVGNALLLECDYLGELLRQHPSRRELQRLFPSFDWR